MGDSQEASPVKEDQESAASPQKDAIVGTQTSRYKILKKMGEGTFGKVFQCWDNEGHVHVAIKISKSDPHEKIYAMEEINVLKHLASNRRAKKYCVQMSRWFEYDNHVCIVFEKLGPSLCDFLKLNKFRPFSVPFVRDFGRQLLSSVECVHNMGLIHTDLKTENILLASSEYKQVLTIKVPDLNRRCYPQASFKLVPKSTAIKLIDFGCAVFDNCHNDHMITTRYYRAPEVILGLRWSYACDMWSIGCILFELCSGELLFNGHEDLQHLAMMERVLGPIPRHMIRNACSSARKLFKKGEKLNWPQSGVSSEDKESVKKLGKLKDLAGRYCTVHQSRASLTELLKGLLAYDPNDRLTAREALDHPFFKEC
ncbi:serine/threonine-protein kinase AFC3-like [Carex rostrata]